MRKLEFILLTLAHYIPVLCAVLFYRIGAGIWFLLIPLQIGLISLDERRCPARKHLIFSCGNLLNGVHALYRMQRPRRKTRR